MVIHLIVIGQKMPSWVDTAYQHYAKRMPSHCQLKLVALPAPARGKSTSIAQAKQREAKRIEAALPKGAYRVVLDETGQQVSTQGVSKKMAGWLAQGQDVALIVGGADGLDQAIKQTAQWQWSLSALTLPHPMVRVVVAEQVYRAWTILANHPYHRT